MKGPKVSKGRSESPLVASAEAKPSVKQEKVRKVFPLPSTRNLFFSRAFPLPQEGPEGFQRAIGKPPGRLRRGETLCKTESNKGIFSLPPTRNLFLVRGFVRLRADEVLSHTGKYPKGAGGGQRVHVSWPPPDPPLLRNSAPLSLAGARPAGFTSVPGRATVAYGAADPSPGVWAPVYPWSVGKDMRQ